MPITLKLSDELIELAKPHALANHRSLSKQIEYWARLGKAADENPDLPALFVKETLSARQEAIAGMCSDYIFNPCPTIRRTLTE